MNLQITNKQLQIVKSILSRVTPNKRYYVFGSRAEFRAKKYSDLDLVTKDPLTPLEYTRLKICFENSDLPFRVDVVEQTMLDGKFDLNLTLVPL